jgi:hypothetical protein
VKTLLVVSPHFPPVNAADHHRVRMMLPHLAVHGWTAHVVAFRPDVVEAVCDPDLLATIPTNTPITQVGAIPPRWTRRLGFGNLALRGAWHYRRALQSLLDRHTFDAAYVSTTILGVVPFDRLFRQRVPTVLDIQDPWVNDYYDRTGIRPPGGWWRYALSNRSARQMEPVVVRQAAHITTVSAAYVEQLRQRYPDVAAEQFTVVPFAASRHDFQVIHKRNLSSPVIPFAEGQRHWVYLGRGGEDMAWGLRGLFTALRELRSTMPEIERLRLHFIGTSYAAAGRGQPSIQPLAGVCGVGDLVNEQTDRVPYLQGLALLQSADTILIVGSDDPGYSASKVYPCIAAGRPIVAVLHSSSPIANIIRDCQAGWVASFDGEQPLEQLVAALKPLLIQRLQTPMRAPFADTNWAAFEPFTAEAMTHKLCRLFDRVSQARKPQ